MSSTRCAWWRWRRSRHRRDRGAVRGAEDARRRTGPDVHGVDRRRTGRRGLRYLLDDTVGIFGVGVVESARRRGIVRRSPPGGAGVRRSDRSRVLQPSDWLGGCTRAWASCECRTGGLGRPSEKGRAAPRPPAHRTACRLRGAVAMRRAPTGSSSCTTTFLRSAISMQATSPALASCPSKSVTVIAPGLRRRRRGRDVAGLDTAPEEDREG